MTLIIRTQDKSKIVIANYVSYECKTKVFKVMQSENVYEQITESRHRLVCCGKLLGEYPTQERCFEIIDDIQRHIESERTFQTITYNMPEI
jgi:hypothetical protein